MPETVAVLSDIHGVLPALDAVLAEPAVRAADLIVVTGDIAIGPQPVAVLDRLLGIGRRAVLVRGNAERELVQLVDGGPTAIPDPIAPWAAAQVATRPDLVTRLRALPYPYLTEVDGMGNVVFCHGTPRDDDEVVLVDSREERWIEVFAELRQDIRTVVCGHTHMPFVRLVDTRLVINPGSVGMPYGGPGAHWALLERGAVTLHTTHFDIEAGRREIAAGSDYGDVDEWTDYYLNSRASDFEALRVFGPRDGR